MKYKAIFLDLDGTTVPNEVDALPSVTVSQAIFKAKKLIHICIATGRPLHIARNIIKHLQISDPCILSGGVQIYNPLKDAIEFEVGLNLESIPKIVHIAKRYNLKIGIFNGHADKSYAPPNLIDKILSIYLPVISPEIINDVEHEMKGISNIEIHKMPSWEKGYMCLEMTDIKATKLNGINQVMKLLNLKKSEIIGVGDSYNDFPLLMASGMKVAMGNAIQELKDIADYVAPSIDDDGVADVIEKFILSSLK
jgi:HAD superfamily hydrolase (TIGR01484 family)